MELVKQYNLLVDNKKENTKEVIHIGVCEEVHYNPFYKINLKHKAFDGSVFVKVDEVSLLAGRDYREVHSGLSSTIEFITYDEISLLNKKVEIYYQGYEMKGEYLPWN